MWVHSGVRSLAARRGISPDDPSGVVAPQRWQRDDRLHRLFRELSWSRMCVAGLSGIEPLNVMPVHWVDDEFGPGSDAMAAGSARRGGDDFAVLHDPAPACCTADTALASTDCSSVIPSTCWRSSTASVAAHATGRHRVRSRPTVWPTVAETISPTCSHPSWGGSVIVPKVRSYRRCSGRGRTG